MAEVMTEQASRPRQLDAATTVRLLSEAVRQGATVRVRATSEEAGLAYTGVVSGGGDAYLTLQLEHMDFAGYEGLAGVQLNVGIEVDDVRYTFETMCTDETPRAEPATLRVRKPDMILRVDRRRSPRRRLRPPATVSLHGTGVKEEWRSDAVMLNLNTEGVACRLAERDGLAMKVGQTTRVLFSLGASATAFDLTGRVTNITRGGTPGHVVVGLAFVADRNLEENRTRLRQALAIAE